MVSSRGLIATEWSLLTVAYVLAVARIYVRLRIRRDRLNLSDFWLLTALGSAQGLVICETLAYQRHGIGDFLLTSVSVQKGQSISGRESWILTDVWPPQIRFACNYFFDVGLYFPKFSMVALYYTLAPSASRGMQISLYGLTIVTTIGPIFALFGHMFWCGTDPSINCSYHDLSLHIWPVAELCVSIMIVSLTALRPLLRKLSHLVPAKILPDNDSKSAYAIASTIDTRRDSEVPVLTGSSWIYSRSGVASFQSHSHHDPTGSQARLNPTGNQIFKTEEVTISIETNSGRRNQFIRSLESRMARNLTRVPSYLESLFGLKGKTAIVTGGSSGIGREMAVALGRAGCRLILVARRKQSLDETLHHLAKFDVEASALTADLADLPSLKGAVETIESTYGTPDILINAAGVNHRPHMNQLSEDIWNTTIAVNLTAPFILGQAFGPRMAERGSGRIINIVSQQSFRAFGNSGAYGASKGGLLSLT
ncbi:hypothetical protein AK830_g2403 [Neonectria ditissima]|uniref:Ketoreductase domain-containing protein n=1 Tax=Neonectria ditissima TaxID=78410 RepID=A0A0P7BVX6_9HYPO|nr:hypothetical protein AK830_g2403 [Neonectria ditissima]